MKKQSSFSKLSITQTQNTPTKSQILSWINNTLAGAQTKIQALGNGTIYALLINHYYPTYLNKNKIIMLPRSHIDNKSNLRKVQQALDQLNIKNISFDIHKVAEMTYAENWQLICKFYNHFSQLQNPSQMQVQESNSQKWKNNTYENSLSQILKNPQNITSSNSILLSSGLLTPIKGMKFFDQNAKIRLQSARLLQQIKNVVKQDKESDKRKVKQLKKMLGLLQQQKQEEELQMKQLLSDCKNKQQVINID